MNVIRKTRFKITYILTIFSVFILLFMMNTSFALEDSVQSTIIINKNGATNGEPIFKSDGIGAYGSWYPGYSASGILRIKNEYFEKVKVENLGMNISLERNNKILGLEEKDAKDYLTYMKIKVEYTNIFKKLFKGVVFEGSFDEFLKGKDCSISIGDDEYIDLKYTISMDIDAGNNTENIKGNVDFTINVSGIEYDEESVDPGPGDPDPVDPNPGNPDPGDPDPGDPSAGNPNPGGSDPGNTNPGTIGNIQGVYNPQTTYSDIDHWAHDCIEELLEHGIIKGYPDLTIRPENYITRAEAAILVGKALDLEEIKNIITNKYIDDLPEWARGYIMATTNEDVFKGYKDDTFRPKNNITREEMTAVLIRGFKKTLDEDIELTFEDKEKIGTWAANYIKAAVENEVIVGYPDKTFKPKNHITRGEAFTIICKLLGYHKEHIEQ